MNFIEANTIEGKRLIRREQYNKIRKREIQNLEDEAKRRSVMSTTPMREAPQELQAKIESMERTRQ